MKRILIFLVVSFFVLACNQMKQIDTLITSDISLSWSFFGNNAKQGYYSAAFVLENKGDTTLSDMGWALYFNQQGLGVINESVTGNVKIEHINGDLLKIIPLEGFRLEPRESVEISYQKPGSMLLHSEAPLHPYMVYYKNDEGKSDTVISVDYQILPFPSLDKFYPEAMNIVHPDASWVFKQNKASTLLAEGETGLVLPTPRKEVYVEETVSFNKDLEIFYQEGLDAEAGFLSDMLMQYGGSAPAIQQGANGGPGMIRLHTDETLASPEAYHLMVEPEEGIVIVGGDRAGVFYGVQTLLSMLPVEAWAKPDPDFDLRAAFINDRPAFSYRGFHLDIARNFIEPDDIKKLIRIMAYYKLNKLHLHMTDDEGWRLEIPSLPELTEVGAHRGHTTNERDHLIPAYGSGPDPDPEGNHGSGYLSRETFVELLRFADAHHIEVIPEINFPGHARAAIYAMEARYDHLMKEGKEEEAEYYRLIDPEDTSVYNSAQNFNDNVICVCTEGPYRLFETVVDELISMYQEAGLTLRILHTGGDEVPRGVWAGSPICRAFLAEHPEIGNFENLQAYFGSRIFDILKKKDLVMGGWEEIVMKKNEEGSWIPNKEFVGKAMLPYVWNSIYENLDLGNRLANAGFELILCNVNNFYFDLAYTHHPAERGLYWGGFVNTRSSFDFVPFDVFKSTSTDKWGNPFDPDTDFRGMTRMSKNAYQRIKGLQAELWSETVKGGSMAEYYYLPKMIGFAERSWCGQASWGRISDQEERITAMDKDWNRFANMVGQRELPRLDYLYGGFNYRLPPPGAVIREGMLHANIDFPGLKIRYTTDGTEPTPDSPLYTGPVEVSGRILLKSFDKRERGSRTSVVD
jgi:hexosaminidase